MLKSKKTIIIIVAKATVIRGYSSDGRALRSHRKGHEFESRYLHQSKPKTNSFCENSFRFFLFLLQTYSYQILFRHYFGVIQRKTDNIQIPTENNNALKLKIAARRIRADRQAVQRRPPAPVGFEFRFCCFVCVGCLNGEAQPSRSFIQAPAIVPKRKKHTGSFNLPTRNCLLLFAF